MNTPLNPEAQAGPRQPWKLSVTQKVWLGFGLALALLLAVVVTAVRSQREFVASTEAVLRTHEVIDELEDIPALLAAAESNQRGYWLTGDARMLANFELAAAQLPPRLQSVRRLTSDHPRLQQRLDQLGSIIEQKLAQLRDAAAARRPDGDETARQKALAIQGVSHTETIREMSAVLVKEERALLAERTAWSAGHARATEIFLLLSGALGIITVWLAGTEVRRDLRARDQARAELYQLNETLEARVTERTAELQAASEELEAFSSSVSHDLRAPLRAIDGFSKILVTEHGQELSSEAREALQLVRANTQQMGQLIDDLLNFARLNRQPLQKETVLPTTLVSAILAELRATGENHAGEIVVGDLPACPADPALLKVVWTNLLSNALKYTRKRDAARIEIGALPGDAWRAAGDGHGAPSPVTPHASRLTRHTSPVYFVRDNGVGFNMAYADKIFGVFQRLHRAEDYEGTGVGLATVQRIIQRHGGNVWAEAELNNGATFYFTLEPAQCS